MKRFEGVVAEEYEPAGHDEFNCWSGKDERILKREGEPATSSSDWLEGLTGQKVVVVVLTQYDLTILDQAYEDLGRYDDQNLALSVLKELSP